MNDFMIDINDDIDNAVFDVIKALVLPDDITSPEGFEWSMEHIGACADMIEVYLVSRGFNTCHPFWCDDERIPCYSSEDRCVYCNKDTNI